MNSCPGVTLYVLLTISLLSLALPQLCLAHREDYIDETLVFLTLERGAFEPEYWFDAGRETNLSRNFIRHSLASEYGITEHWMVDGRVSFRQMSGQRTRFESGRFETRYRFGEEGERPVDVAVSAEVNTVRLPSGEDESGIEPRLVLSKDFADLNLTLNLPLEISLKSGATSFAPAFGIRYDTSERFRIGAEIRDETEQSAGAVIPQIWLVLSEALTFKAGYSLNLAHNREHFFRAALEVEL